MLVVSAGGTGGHMFPAQAVAERYGGGATALITDPRGARFIEPGTYADTLTLPMAGFGSTRGGVAGKIHATATSIFQARRFLRRTGARAVIGFGGYASVPAVIAAKSLNIPVILHEQNAVLGRANRTLARIAGTVCLSYPDTSKAPANTRFTGLPLRQRLHDHAVSADKPDTETLHILILGGSQGAALFDQVPAAVRTFDTVFVTHQCRPEQVEALHQAYQGVAGEVAPFFIDIEDKLMQADIIIARAGASTIGEIQAFGRASILVPFAAAKDDHQSHNAAYMAGNNAALVLHEADFSTASIHEAITMLISDADKRKTLATHARALYHPDAAEKILECI